MRKGIPHHAALWMTSNIARTSDGGLRWAFDPDVVCAREQGRGPSCGSDFAVFGSMHCPLRMMERSAYLSLGGHDP